MENNYYTQFKKYFEDNVNKEYLNYLKIFLNPYQSFVVYNNTKMDMFGYLSFRLTEYKEQNVFKYPLTLRAFMVLIPVLISFKCNYN